MAMDLGYTAADRLNKIRGAQANDDKAGPFTPTPEPRATPGGPNKFTAEHGFAGPAPGGPYGKQHGFSVSDVLTRRPGQDTIPHTTEPKDKDIFSEVDMAPKPDFEKKVSE